ncbi:MAG: histidine kinase [Bacteroidales bacterium]|jgi:ligand-binding sensor domain-containing protein|nr:histidine kinase [Bacteroidales bacterium]
MPQKSNTRIFLSGLLLAIFFFPDFIVCGQNYTIRSFTTADGLPHNNVRAIAMDSSGFLWIGTWDGLSRFDGHEFRNYFHEPDDSTSIPYFSINELVVDKGNNIWILPDTRVLTLYNRNSDNFLTINKVAGVTLDFINNISVDREGNLLILGRESILIRDPDKSKCEILKLIDSQGNPWKVEDQKNWFSLIDSSEIWIMGVSAIRKFSKRSAKDYVFEGEYRLERNNTRGGIYFDYTEWYTICRSSSGSMWIFSNDGIFRLNETDGVFREQTADIPVEELTGRKAFYWGKRGDGLFFYKSGTRKIIHIPDNQAKWLSSFMTDGSDSFWYSNVTSYGVAQGISMATLIPGYFRNTLIESPDSTTPAVYSVIMDKDRNIWTAVRGFDHIVRISPDGQTGQVAKLDSKALSEAGYIRSLLPVQNGIWIGYYINLLQFHDYSTGRTTVHNAKARSFRAIATDRSENLFIGTDNISIYHPTTGETKILWSSNPDINIFRIYADTLGIVWAGMNSSKILKYDTGTGESSIIRVASGISNVEDVIAGEDGDLWIALLGKGVCRYNTINRTIRYYTTSKGLTNNTTYSLLKDNSGNIWVSTNDGISMINPETERIRTFDEADGIAISEFNSGARFIAGDGEFFFGGMGGFIRFYPDSISHKESSDKKERILLTDLRVSGESKHLQGILNNIDTLIFNRGENNFHMYFSSTDFVNSDKTIFRYMLSGINHTWEETGLRTRNINYTNLRPSWYRLLIEATDNNGNWTISKKMTIRIKPAFYQTRVFMTIVPLLILSVIVFSVILYIRQIKQRERSKHDELKLQSLRSQMNPHFVFNALNSINYFISNNDKLSANRYIADFSRLIRAYLSNMGQSFVPLGDELNSIRDYLQIEHLRFGDKFEYSIDTTGIGNIQDVEVCPGIAGPFIENAIWHGVRSLNNRKGKIKISFEQYGDHVLKCIIEDDGIGRSASLRNRGPAVNHRSKGINMVEERLTLTGKLTKTNYRLTISDLHPEHDETGTRVEVDIPARPLQNRNT